ncbi:MAG: hypothetical protein ACYDHZ_06460 [Dehalococcoidia bacterium]
MKYVAIAVLIIAALFAGCLRPAIDTKIPPVAIIDSVSSSQVYTGDNVKFTGHGVSTTGQIIGYNWRSSINGDLSKLATFDISTLSAGSHNIWFSVQDNYGNWSKEIATDLTVLPHGGPATMSIKVFSASPPMINEGDWSTLTWDVSGDGTVRIDPDVGNVAYNGNRSVQPMQNTTYTLYATNDAGITTASAQVVVTPIALQKVVLYSVSSEGGTIMINSGAFNYGPVLVGEDRNQSQMQGILSFDISSIPYNAVIKTVQLDLSRSIIFNYPFPWQGDLFIYNLKSGLTLNEQNQLTFVSSNYIFRWGTNSQITQMPGSPFTSVDIVSGMQRQVDSRNSRFQVRMQFEKFYHYNVWDLSSTTNQKLSQPSGKVGNYIDISAGNPTLIVGYVLAQ